MTHNDNFSVLVNSCDGFEDCWNPFFTLFQRYWPECDARIFLNTERKNWQYGGLDITCTQVQDTSPERLTWSECLIKALDQVQTPLVLYFQEDYFIHQPARHALIQQAVEYMAEHPEIGHIALTRHCSIGPYERHAEKWLQTIGQRARYRLCTQASLWRVDTLRSYIDSRESGWMFEIFGTWRAHKRPDTFLSTKWDAAAGGPVIDYLHTGIIKGKWLPAIENVFESNDIKIDYSKRGFYKKRNFILNKIETTRKLISRPKLFVAAFFGF